ncbi:MAG: hypothetical protein ACLPZ0_17240, partial [Steroidobacteraceae bacterium]
MMPQASIDGSDAAGKHRRRRPPRLPMQQTGAPMTLHAKENTKENLRSVLDFLVARSQFGPAMQAIGASAKLIFAWLKRSAHADPDFGLLREGRAFC